MHTKVGIIKIKMIMVILILFPILISAQHLKLGLDAELSYIRIISTKGNKSMGLSYDETFSPVTFNLIIGYNLNKNLTFQTHIGKTLIAVEFSGFEFGLNGIYHYNKKFYASAGVLQHSNEGSGSNSYGVSYASLFMLTAGIGYHTSKYFALELNFYYPTKRKEIIGYNKLYYSEGFNPRWNFYYMLRLGFVFALENR